MTKLEAIQAIGTVYSTHKNTKTAGSRLVRALRVLELDDDDILTILIETAYANGNGIVMDGVVFNAQKADSREASAS